ncbi:MAG: hypothetical protein RIB57_12455 [Pelagibacterium sp.]|uniref:hypothetical protein n=1 Tax=Pelagibacterium sp. TaxID=1967288 RepID=UPI0032EB68D9
MSWADCSEWEFFCYLASVEGTVAATWFGLIVTILGLSIALVQIAKARSAAEAANAAVSGLKVHLDGVNLAYVSGQLNTIIVATRSNEFALAQSLFSPIKRSLRLQVRVMQDGLIDLGVINRMIASVDRHLEWGRSGGPKFSHSVMHRSLDELLDIVTGWEGDLESAAKSEK